MEILRRSLHQKETYDVAVTISGLVQARVSHTSLIYSTYVSLYILLVIALLEALQLESGPLCEFDESEKGYGKHSHFGEVLWILENSLFNKLRPLHYIIFAM